MTTDDKQNFLKDAFVLIRFYTQPRRNIPKEFNQISHVKFYDMNESGDPDPRIDMSRSAIVYGLDNGYIERMPDYVFLYQFTDKFIKKYSAVVNL